MGALAFPRVKPAFKIVHLHVTYDTKGKGAAACTKCYTVVHVHKFATGKGVYNSVH